MCVRARESELSSLQRISKRGIPYAVSLLPTHHLYLLQLEYTACIAYKDEWS